MRKSKKPVETDLLFIFKYARIWVSCNPDVFSKEQEEEISRIAN